MSVKTYEKNNQFLNDVFTEISNIVDSYQDGHLSNPYELKKALYESIEVNVKQSFINGIKVGKRQKSKNK